MGAIRAAVTTATTVDDAHGASIIIVIQVKPLIKLKISFMF